MVIPSSRPRAAVFSVLCALASAAVVPYYDPPGQYPVYGNVPNAIVCANDVRLNRYEIDSAINSTLVQEAQGQAQLQPFQLPATISSEDLKLVCDAQPEELYQIRLTGGGSYDTSGSALLIKQDGTFCGAVTEWRAPNDASRGGNCIFCPVSKDGTVPEAGAPNPALCSQNSGSYDEPPTFCIPNDYNAYRKKREIAVFPTPLPGEDGTGGPAPYPYPYPPVIVDPPLCDNLRRSDGDGTGDDPIFCLPNDYSVARKKRELAVAPTPIPGQDGTGDPVPEPYPYPPVIVDPPLCVYFRRRA